MPPQLCCPVGHAMPHVVPSHVAATPPGVGQGEHDVPHVAGSVSLTHALPHRWKPAVQTIPHAPAVQVARPLAGTGHAWPHIAQLAGSFCVLVHRPLHSEPVAEQPVLHTGVAPELSQNGAALVQTVVHAPQCADVRRSASQPLAGSRSQSAKPGLHVNAHAVPSHVAVALAGAAQGAHALPQVATELLVTHVPPQSWKPALHCDPQRTPSHVAVALAGAPQGAHAAPHVAGAVSLTQAPEQRWWPVGQPSAQRPAWQTPEPPVGAGQAMPHIPQLRASVCVSVQVVPHRVCARVAQPLVQA
jgi:hypothetical protein